MGVWNFLVAISRSIKLMCYNTHDNVHVIPTNWYQMCIFISAAVRTMNSLGAYWHELPGAHDHILFEIPINTQPDPFRPCNYFISWVEPFVTRRLYADEDNFCQCRGLFFLAQRGGESWCLRPGRVEVDMRGHPTEEKGHNGETLCGEVVTIWRAGKIWILLMCHSNNSLATRS